MSLENKTFNELITFTRSTGGGLFNAAGQYKWLPANEPRFDFDPVTLEPRGILIEEQRTNLLLRSSEFDNASWVKGSSSITANSTIAPDGTMTADRLVENTAAGVPHLVTSNVFAVNPSSTYVVSIFVRAESRSRGRLRFGTNVGFVNSVAFDLSTATIPGDGSTSSISSIGGGWYRVAVIGVTQDNAASADVQIYLRDNSGSEVYTGDGTSGFYIWGAQLEAGAFPTSYIPTTTAQVTRAADLCSVGNLSPWYRADEGTLMVEASTNKPTNALIAVSGGSLCETTINAATIARFSGSNLTNRVSKGGTTVSLFGADPYTAQSTYKAALALKVGSFASSFNGGTLHTSSQAGVMPLPVRLCVGNLNNVGEFLNGHIRSIRYIPRRISDTDLQALTAL